MSIYINGIGNISAQKTFESDSFLEETVGSQGARFNCVEPDYTAWIDAKAIRRMSRVIKMGVAAAGLALKEAGLNKPDGIITGTGYGCLDDTGIFLSKMIANNEQSLNPTPFIQSTHNSIGSQIGLILQCLGYNQTYVQGTFSMETSLVDAMMMLVENPDQNLLVGGVDEITEISHTILSRFGLYNHGARQGEGAAFFLLSNHHQKSTYATVKDVRMIYQPSSTDELAQKVRRFLDDNSINSHDVDLVLLGSSGDLRYDGPANSVAGLLGSAQIKFKNLCGEYPTSTGFALWLGSAILKRQQIPTQLTGIKISKLRNILIFNSSLRTHHSLILLQRAET